MALFRHFRSRFNCPKGQDCRTCYCTLKERIERAPYIPTTFDEDFLQKIGFRKSPVLSIGKITENSIAPDLLPVRPKDYHNTSKLVTAKSSRAR